MGGRRHGRRLPPRVARKCGRAERGLIRPPHPAPAAPGQEKIGRRAEAAP